MRPLYVRLMDKLYLACIGIGIVSVVCMVGLIFSGVVMRYLFSLGARFAEPMSIFFTVQLTMYGAAACYRAHAHLRLRFFVNLLSARLQRVPDLAVHLLMGGVALFMIWYGVSLARITWFQAYPEFDYVKVGFVYSAIPGSGVILLLFVLEGFFYPAAMRDADEEELERAISHAEEEEGKEEKELSLPSR